MNTYGTHCFVSIKAALTYFAAYGYDSQDVADKIDRDEIVIGEPTLQPGEHLQVNKAEGRYFIQSKY